MAPLANEGQLKKVPKRRFSAEWKKEFPWLHHDEEEEKMFCTVWNMEYNCFFTSWYVIIP